MEQTTITPEQYQTLLETTPQEVRDFLYSENYEKMVGLVAKNFSITDTKKLSDIIFDIVIGAADEEETLTKVASLGVPEEKKIELFQYVNSFFLQPLLLHTLGIAELEKTELAETEESVQPEKNVAQAIAVSPLEAIQSIKERLSQKTVVPPIARDYSIEKPSAPTLNTPEQKTPDPYREIPER